jgi:glycosyltransferase involved in cell wall biosynthesis
VLREVGGDAALYCAPADVDRWIDIVSALIDERRRAPGAWAARRQAGWARASRFSWDDYARRMIEIYTEISDFRVQSSD